MERLAIVILNFNGQHFLEKFLPQVIRYSAPAQIVVADNGSTDDSVNWLQQYFPEVVVIKLEKNEGFCQGYNLALQRIQADYYVLLNSDVEVTPGWTEPIVRLMESQPDVGACQPKILSFYQRTHFEYAGAAGGWLDKWGYPFCRGRIFEVTEEDKGQYNDTADIFWATGACMFVRAGIYHQLGGLDSDFFAHMEEIDLCWRMQNAGYRIVYCSESKVYHVGGGTLPKSNPKKTFLNFRNGLALLYKNLPENRLYRTLFIRMVLDGIAAVKFLVGGNLRDFLAVIRAHFSFYATWKNWKEKRSVHRKTSWLPLRGLYARSIVFDYYVWRRKTFQQLFRM
jgi:GT2 family glycosyltransferase